MAVAQLLVVRWHLSMSEQMRVTLGVLIVIFYVSSFYSLYRRSKQVKAREITFGAAFVLLALLFVISCIEKLIWGFPWSFALIGAALVGAGALGIWYCCTRAR